MKMRNLLKEGNSPFEKNMAKFIFTRLKSNTAIQPGELAGLSYEIAEIMMDFFKENKINVNGVGA